MNEQEKRAALAQYFISKSIFDAAAQEAEIQKLADSLPPATAAEKGVSSVIDKAYLAYQIKEGTLTDTAPAKREKAQPLANISPAERAALSRTLSTQMIERKRFAAGSAVQQFVVSQPPQSDYIKNTTGIVNYDSWKKSLDKIDASKVVPEDKGAYDAIVAKAVANAEMAALISTKLPTAVKLYKVKTPDLNSPKFMTQDELCMLLVLKTDGTIEDPNDKTKPSVGLRIVGGKADPKNIGTTKPSKTIVSVNHKAETFKNADNVVIAKVPNTTVSKEYSVRSQESFRIYTGKTAADGTQITRTVRVPLKIQGYGLDVKDDFAAVFAKESGSVKKKSARLFDAVVLGIDSYLKNTDSNIAMIASEYSQELAAFQAPTPSAPKGDI